MGNKKQRLFLHVAPTPNYIRPFTASCKKTVVRACQSCLLVRVTGLLVTALSLQFILKGDCYWLLSLATVSAHPVELHFLYSREKCD